jgi:hypothetical protein
MESVINGWSDFFVAAAGAENRMRYSVHRSDYRHGGYATLPWLKSFDVNTG